VQHVYVHMQRVAELVSVVVVTWLFRSKPKALVSSASASAFISLFLSSCCKTVCDQLTCFFAPIFSRLREACSLAEERVGERELAEGLPYLNRVCHIFQSVLC